MAKVLFLGLVAIVSTTGAQAHDLGGTRARLVQYDRKHLSLTMLIRLSDVLQAQCTNRDQYRTRMLALAAMKPNDFANEMNKLETHLAADTRIRLNGRTDGVIGRWHWPQPATAQAQVRVLVMNAVSGGTANTVHEEPIEVDAEISSGGAITAAAMKFPRELGSVVLVAYRPSQVITNIAKYSTDVLFR